MRNLLAIILLLTFPIVALADGTNKKKRKPKPRVSRPKVVTKSVTKVKAKVEVKSLLETKYDLAVTPEMRPTQPLLDIPVVPVPPIVETETRVFEIEQEKDRKGLIFLIGGAIAGGAIAIILSGDEPLVTPQTTPAQPVPEPTSALLFASGLLLLGWGMRKTR